MSSTPRSPISRRIQQVQESATLAIDAKAKALKAAGEDVIGFGAGEPDFPTPEHIVEAAQKAAADPAMHHYTPAGGMPALREAIAQKTLRDSGMEVDASQVVVANGGKHALYSVFMTLVDEGDEVLLPAPYWVSYPEQIRLAGGVVVELPTTVDTNFRVTLEQLEAARTPRTKVLVFASPSNPTGAVYPMDEVVAIGQWAAAHGIWVVTDEIYEHLVYGDSRFISMPAVVPELRERCVIVNGVAKTYAMTGWRVGWSIAPKDVTAGILKLQSHLSSNVSNVAQAAALAAVSGGLDDVAVMRETYDRRRQITHERLNAMPGVVCPELQGAFYALPSIEGTYGREVGGRVIDSAMTFCEIMLESAKVAMVPGEGFGAPGYVRISYALSDADLVEGLDRMATALA